MEKVYFILIALVITAISVIVLKTIINYTKKIYKKKALDKFEIYYQQYLREGLLVCRNLFTNLQLDKETVKIRGWRFNLGEIQDVKFRLSTDFDYIFKTYVTIYVKYNNENKRIHLQHNNISSTIGFLLVLKFILTKKTEYNKEDLEALLVELEY